MAQAASHFDVRLKRAYLPPPPEDGVRVLVDRLWPRACANRMPPSTDG